jgi:hypothetical protein
MKISPMPRSATSLSRMPALELHGHVERRGRLVGDQQFRARRPASSRSSRAGPCRRRPRADKDRRRGRIADLHRLQHGERPSRARALLDLLCAQSSRRSVGRCVITGSSEYFGSCRIMAMRLPRSSRRPFGGAVSRSMPSKLQRLGRDLGPARRQAHDRAAGLRLARAGFADDAEPLAAERERDAAHRLHALSASGRRTRRSSTVSSGSSCRPSGRARRAGRRRAG